MLPGRLLTSLVLLSSLLLALPRGWCCILAALATKAGPASCCLAGKGKAAPAKRACCQPAEKEQPPAPGRPMPADSCPCAGRNATLPDHPELPAADLPACPGAAGLPPPLPLVCAFVEPPSAWLPYSPPPRVLKCLWLC